MAIRTADLDREQTYKILSGVIVPRPIAWITTVNENGTLNAAPFSAFTYVSIKPPMVGVNIAKRAGQRKDTALNISRNKEFVVNIADQSLIEALHTSALEFPSDISEIDVLGLTGAPSECIQTPRIAQAPVSMECRFHSATEFGAGGAEFYVGEILAIHVREDLLVNGKIDSAALDPIARLAGPNYAQLGKIITMPILTELAKTVLK